MRTEVVEQFFKQSRAAAKACVREVGKRAGLAGMMTLICSLAGYTASAAMIFVIIALAETVTLPMNRYGAKADSQMTPRKVGLLWLANCCLLLPYLAYGIVLSQSSSLPFVIAAYIWIFGILLHVSYTPDNLSFYSWPLVGLCGGASIAMLLMVANNPAFAAPTWQWIITAALFLLCGINVFSTMHWHRSTQATSVQARDTALSALNKLEALSGNDNLTGLMNWQMFEDAVKQAAREQGDITVFVIDVDGIKPIKDSYGHAAGDAMTCAVADRLRDLAGPNGFVGRLSDSAFGLACHDIGGPAQAQMQGDKIAFSLRQPLTHDNKRLNIGTCVGIAQLGKDIDSAVDLLSGADQAMALSRQDPDHRAIVFDKRAFPVRVTLKDRAVLLAAMQSGEILPYYQPKVCTETGKIMGFEALSRWQHPDRGLLSPMSFLPMIAELGLHSEFMLHTAAHVLDDIQTLVADDLDPGQVSINIPEVTLATVSGRTELSNLIDRYPDLRKYLTFEITEDVFIEHSSGIIRESIAAFHKAGVRISLDDFGTGFASFQHLRDLEFDELKLDTRFISDLGTDPAATVLIDGFLTIGDGLGVQVIAEGVEHEVQLEMLRKMGCKYAQGYYFGAAVAFPETHLRLMIADANFSSAHRRKSDAAQPRCNLTASCFANRIKCAMNGVAVSSARVAAYSLRVMPCFVSGRVM
ncbi:diguanylate cyclase (GGDEF)-like protein [Yoonia sediminilitoris]|uniref:Diguanylate cyclase (GGDEF)-like protein n=1 Tax=Yoonia sediminilitoris TaxID=1286148 RepID=A0A2T6KJS5_9RHOB|nr:diguanylate cyclase (GGDEF)-like protein [Yoonia sediminilitoris]RCW96518.1 diguanylate cyclase (GGDEF)-like protein [Yoonia sediminilitoris]